MSCFCNGSPTLPPPPTSLGRTNCYKKVRAAEDLLALTRSMKEAWLFGQLGSELGVVDPKTDENAREAGLALQRLAAGSTREPEKGDRIA